MSNYENIPILDDEAEDPIDPDFANTDQQLAKDEDDAIDSKNTINDRLRHAKPQTQNKYNEGPDEDDLPVEVD